MIEFLRAFFSSFLKENDHGLVPDLEQDADPRNVRYEDLAPLGGDEALPLSVDIFDRVDQIENLNQGKSASCTCQALVHSVVAQTGKLLSPRDAFYKIKTDKKYKSSELRWGAYMLDPVRLLINEGVAEFNALYDVQNPASDLDYIQPSKEAQKSFKGGAYIYVTNSSDSVERWRQVMRYLAFERKPVLVGMQWASSFNKARSGGVVPAVTPTGSIAGHAMVAVAYKNIVTNGKSETYVGCENSWGNGWGDKGRIWLPIRFVRSQSGIGYVVPDTTDVEPPLPKPVVRDLFKEKFVASELRKKIDATFPFVGIKDANAKNIEARAIAGRNWLVLVPAVTYYGWTITDVINHLYAQSRRKTTEKAYSLDFTKPKV